MKTITMITFQLFKLSLLITTFYFVGLCLLIIFFSISQIEDDDNDKIDKFSVGQVQNKDDNDFD